MPTTIRRATAKDLKALAALNDHVQSLHAHAHPNLFRCKVPRSEVVAAFRKLIKDPAAVWLIAETDLPVGYLYAQFHDRPKTCGRPARRICNINHIAIHPDLQRQGVGRRLIAAIVAEAKKSAYPRIELDVWSFNHEARAAFERLGFAVFNERMELRHPAHLRRRSPTPRRRQPNAASARIA